MNQQIYINIPPLAFIQHHVLCLLQGHALLVLPIMEDVTPRGVHTLNPTFHVNLPRCTVISRHTLFSKVFMGHTVFEGTYKNFFGTYSLMEPKTVTTALCSILFGATKNDAVFIAMRRFLQSSDKHPPGQSTKSPLGSLAQNSSMKKLTCPKIRPVSYTHLTLPTKRIV